MENVVGAGGLRQAWKKTDMPASAQSYFLRVMRPALPEARIRDRREAETLCVMMDHIALGRLTMYFSLELKGAFHRAGCIAGAGGDVLFR